MGQLIDLTGRKFGKLTVVKRVEDHIQKSGVPKAMWLCKCECGGERIVYGQTLRAGKATDCGCGTHERLSALSRERATTHDGSKTRLYRIWRSMRERCSCEYSKVYRHYGGRGIHVCPEWNDFSVFREWAYANGYDPNAKRGKSTIDRIDVDGNYEPGNCRFVDMAVQARNTRRSWMVEYDGRIQCISDWARELGIKRATLRYRLKNGWSIERAFAAQ